MKDGLALIIAKKMRKNGGSSGEDSHLADLEMPAEDLIDAVKAGDARRVARALKDAYEVCHNSGGSEEPAEDTDYGEDEDEG